MHALLPKPVSHVIKVFEPDSNALSINLYASGCGFFAFHECEVSYNAGIFVVVPLHAVQDERFRCMADSLTNISNTFEYPKVCRNNEVDSTRCHLINLDILHYANGQHGNRCFACLHCESMQLYFLLPSLSTKTLGTNQYVVQTQLRASVD